MIINLEEYRFFIKTGVTDLRKAVNGLSAIVQNEMKEDLFSKRIFLFCNRSRKLMKVLYWDETGFCLWQKRLERDKYPWPANEEEAKEISYEELRMLLRGIDFFKAHKKISYKRV